MRAHLEPLQEGHALALAACLGEAATCERAQLPFGRLQGAQTFVTQRVADQVAGRCLPFVIVAEGGTAGYACLHAPKKGTPAEIVFAVAPVYRRCGLARASCEALIASAEAKGWRTVVAHCFADNHEAAALLLALGFQSGKASSPDRRRFVLERSGGGGPPTPSAR